MSAKVQKLDGGQVLEVQVSGKLTKDDYQHFVPEIEQSISEHGKIRVLLDMRDFHGWEAGALWEDVKFDVRHFSDIERLAMVGEKKWQKGMSHFCRPFTSAAIRYFDRSAANEARQWVEARGQPGGDREQTETVRS